VAKYPNNLVIYKIKSLHFLLYLRYIDVCNLIFYKAKKTFVFLICLILHHQNT